MSITVINNKIEYETWIFLFYYETGEKIKSEYNNDLLIYFAFYDSNNCKVLELPYEDLDSILRHLEYLYNLPP